MLPTSCARFQPFLYRVSPKVKVLSIFAFVAVTSTLHSTFLLMAAAMTVMGLALFSGIGFRCLLNRVLIVLPFVGFMLAVLPFSVPGEVLFSFKIGPFLPAVSQQGLDRSAMLGLRVLTAVLAVNILTVTTPLSALMNVFRSFKVPVIFIQVFEFTLRYLFVLNDEVRRMSIARKSRGFEPRGYLFSTHIFRVLGQLVGVLFIRSWERGERIYCAMLSRGYSAGTHRKEKTSRLKTRDLLWGMGVLAVAVSLRLIESNAGLWQVALFK